MISPAFDSGANIIGLTPRQLRVIDALASGKPAKKVAGDLKLTIHQVTNDIQRAIHTLDAGNTAGLVATALRRGWIE